MEIGTLVKYSIPTEEEKALIFEVINFNEITGHCQIKLTNPETIGIDPGSLLAQGIETVRASDIEKA